MIHDANKDFNSITKKKSNEKVYNYRYRILQELKDAQDAIYFYREQLLKNDPISKDFYFNMKLYYSDLYELIRDFIINNWSVKGE